MPVFGRSAGGGIACSRRKSLLACCRGLWPLITLQRMRLVSLLLPAAAAVAQTAPRVPDLADPPIAGTALQYLDSGPSIAWTASNGPVQVNATVPGDLLTDLQASGVIGDPLYELNWVPEGTAAAPIWDASRWNYTATFDASPALLSSAKEAWLVFEGIKMAADIFLNGRSLGFTADQFLRYTFPVGSNGVLRAKGNVLTVSFTTSVDIRNSEARWSACSGGWGAYCNCQSRAGAVHPMSLMVSSTSVGAECRKLDSLLADPLFLPLQTGRRTPIRRAPPALTPPLLGPSPRASGRTSTSCPRPQQQAVRRSPTLSL